MHCNAFHITLKQLILNIKGITLVRLNTGLIQCTNYVLWGLLPVFGTDCCSQAAEKFPSSSDNTGRSCSAKANSICEVSEPSILCAGSKAELGFQQNNCHEKHMNLNKNLSSLFLTHTPSHPPPHPTPISWYSLFISLQGIFHSTPNFCAVIFQRTTGKKLETFVGSCHILETVNPFFFFLLPQWQPSHVPAKNLFFSFHVFCSSFLN